MDRRSHRTQDDWRNLESTWELIISHACPWRGESLSLKPRLSDQLKLVQLLQVKFTLGEQITKNPYHTLIIQKQLSRAIPQLVPEIYEEVADAFNEFIPLTAGEIRTSQHAPYGPDTGIDWTGVKALETIMNIVCRASNRVFVGRPLCRL